MEVLEFLQESCLGKLKLIPIGPPYNKGNDFIYRYDFPSSIEENVSRPPLHIEVRDKSFCNGASKINIFENFKMNNPYKSVKVI